MINLKSAVASKQVRGLESAYVCFARLYEDEPRERPKHRTDDLESTLGKAY